MRNTVSSAASAEFRWVGVPPKKRPRRSGLAIMVVGCCLIGASSILAEEPGTSVDSLRVVQPDSAAERSSNTSTSRAAPESARPQIVARLVLDVSDGRSVSSESDETELKWHGAKTSRVDSSESQSEPSMRIRKSVGTIGARPDSTNRVMSLDSSSEKSRSAMTVSHQQPQQTRSRHVAPVVRVVASGPAAAVSQEHMRRDPAVVKVAWEEPARLTADSGAGGVDFVFRTDTEDNEASPRSDPAPERRDIGSREIIKMSPGTSAELILRSAFTAQRLEKPSERRDNASWTAKASFDETEWGSRRSEAAEAEVLAGPFLEADDRDSLPRDQEGASQPFVYQSQSIESPRALPSRVVANPLGDPAELASVEFNSFPPTGQPSLDVPAGMPTLRGTSAGRPAPLTMSVPGMAPRQHAATIASTPERIGPFAVHEHDGELSVVVSRSKMLRTEASVAQVTVADPKICEASHFTSSEVSISGKQPGTTSVTFWFDEKDRPPVTFLVHVVPEPEPVAPRKSHCELLEEVLAKLFPRSQISLQRSGETLTIKGRALSEAEVADVLAVVRDQVIAGHVAGGEEHDPITRVVNSLWIPGKR